MNNESKKTLIFVAVAAILAAVAFFTRPIRPEDDGQQRRGPLFAAFTPQEAASLSIDEFDEKTGQVFPFQVAKVNGVWSIPSHENYPADAKEQMAAAAASLMNLDIYDVASDSPGDHELYGVIAPTEKELGQSKAKGIGARVTLADEKGRKLVDIVIGKAVKDSPDYRYVRKGKADAEGVYEDSVYVVKVQLDKLNTKFENWIERDVLQLGESDISRLDYDNYSVDLDSGKPTPGDKFSLLYDAKKFEWGIEGLKPDEELDRAKINDATKALDDLVVVDVRRKPAGLSAYLKDPKQEFAITPATVRDLALHGFFLDLEKGGVHASEGVTLVKTKEGIEYQVFFGQIALGTGGKRDNAKTDAAKTDPAKTDAAKTEVAAGSNRFLWVLANYDESLIPKPELEPLPGAAKPAGEIPPAPTKTDAAKTDVAPPAKTTPETPSSKTAEPPPAKTPAPPGGGGDGDSGVVLAQGDPAKTEPAKTEAAKTEPAITEAKTEPAKTEPAPTEPAKTEPAKTEPAKTTPAPDQAELERITADNKRKLDDYEKQKKDAQEKVGRLNERFADWYFVISDDVFKKVRLDRKAIIKKKAPPTETTPPGPPAIPGISPLPKLPDAP